MLAPFRLEVTSGVVIWDLELLTIQNGMEAVLRFEDGAGPAGLGHAAAGYIEPRRRTWDRRNGSRLCFRIVPLRKPTRLSLEMLRLIVKTDGFSFQPTIPTDGFLKEGKDPAVPGLTGSLAALSAMAAIWVTNFLALYLTVPDVSRYYQSKRSLMVGNL